jgi:hypothetical protein
MAFNMTYLFADTIPPDVDVVAAAAVAPTERIPYVLDVLKNVGKLGGRADGSHVLSYPSVIIPTNTRWSYGATRWCWFDEKLD